MTKVKKGCCPRCSENTTIYTWFEDMLCIKCIQDITKVDIQADLESLPF